MGDPRRLSDGSQIPIKKAMNKYIVTCDTMKAIIDLDYFLKGIEECEQNRMMDIKRKELGIVDDNLPLQPPISDWDLLNNLPDDEYLRQTIYPLLYPVRIRFNTFHLKIYRFYRHFI